jgi:hypothetical protein
MAWHDLEGIMLHLIFKVNYVHTLRKYLIYQQINSFWSICMYVEMLVVVINPYMPKQFNKGHMMSR